MQLALVLWSGSYGGAEASSVTLARHLRGRGMDAGVVFVGDAGVHGDRARRHGVPVEEMGISRGSRVVFHPRRLASVVRSAGADGAILVASGYLSGALRLGGYRAPIVSVEHGSVLQWNRLSVYRRMLRRADRWFGARCSDADVAVSDFVREELGRRAHASRLLTIHHGVDLREFQPGPASPTAGHAGALRIACAARLVGGKGIEDLLLGFSRLPANRESRLLIAGDGPERDRLVSTVERLGISERVLFSGWVTNMPEFWRDADVAVVPSGTLPEAFGMVALEAMACGTPVVATRNGGLSEIVSDGESGLLVAPGDADGMAAAIDRLATDALLRERLSRGARRRAEELFSAERSAQAYETLFRSLRPGSEGVP